MLVAPVTLPLALFGPLGGSEMLLIAVIALLLFGKDLPEVARTWGKHFTEFRRHINGLKSDLTDAMYAEERPRLQYHPEFHSRDPLPEAIPAEPSSDATTSNATAGEVATTAPAATHEAGGVETDTFRAPADGSLPPD